MASRVDLQQPGCSEYFFGIEGLPAGYTWKKLKDLARKEAPNLGWTEIVRAKDQGWIKVKHEKEAYKLYDFLRSDPIPNRRLRVHLWLTVTSRAVLIACNCPPSGCASAIPKVTKQQDCQTTSNQEWSTTPPSPIVFLVPPPVFPTSQPELNPALQIPLNSTTIPLKNQNLLSTRLSGESPPFLPLVASQQQQQYQPSYIRANHANGLPINISAGCVTTESRGVFVTGLPASTTLKSLTAHLCTAGPLETCKIQTNTSSGQTRIYSFARFATREYALKAIGLLNGTTFEGRRISVRLDKVQDVVVARWAGETAPAVATTVTTKAKAKGDSKGKKGREDATVVVIANGSTC